MNIMNYVKRDVVTITPAHSIDAAISLMEERGIHHLVVVDGDLLAGMLSDRDILLSTGWMLAIERLARTPQGAYTIGPTRISQIMSRWPVALAASDDARTAAALFVERKIAAAPVLQGGRLGGIVTETDLLRWLSDLATPGTAAYALLRTDVRGAMCGRVVSVAPDTPIGDLIDLFRRRRIRHVPVIEEGRLVGIVSDRDVRRALGWANIRDMQAQEEGRMFEGPELAHQIMKTDVLTLAPTDSMRAALKLMLEKRIHSVPIVQDEHVVGMLTQTDFIKMIASEELL